MESEQESINGVYELPDWVTPLSQESISVNKSVSRELTEVPELAKRGALNPDNFAVTHRGIETEGGKITDAATGYPQITAKTPYRYRDMELIINDLLELINVSESSVDLPDINIGNTFQSRGRIGYDIVGTQQFGSSNPITWQGFVTDWIHEGGSFFVLYNAVRGDRANRATLLEVVEATGATSVLYRAPNSTTYTTEFWKLAKNGNEIAILATDGAYTDQKLSDFDEIPPVADGTYDSRKSGSSSYIFSYNISSGSRTSVVQKNAALKCMLGHYCLLYTSPSPRDS